MKNHIKNYIKITGLAAVPFGTLQAENYEIKVTQEYKCDPNDPGVIRGSTIFDISVSKNGGKPCECHIISRISSCWYTCSSSSLKGYASHTPIYRREDVGMFNANTYMSPLTSSGGGGMTTPRLIFVPCSEVAFLIVVDPLRKYGGLVCNLIIKADDESSNFYISSDVPTMGCGKMRSYCSDNEIVDASVRLKCLGMGNKLTTLFFVYCENAV